jgi:hypothetical protein
MESKKPVVAAAGWATLSCVISLTDDAQLDIAELKKLLQRVGGTIHDQADPVKSTMNRFVIALGTYVKPLTAEAIATAKRMGTITIDVGDTACKVPSAAEYIDKAKAHGVIGKKRKTVKC